MSRESTPTSSSTDPRRRYLLGDPDCPYCHGLGYLRQDLPIDHPDFGKMRICSCRQAAVGQTIGQRLYRFSNLEALSHLTFETFQPRGQPGRLTDGQADTLEQAYLRAKDFAQNLNGWLLLMGSFGCGKTHLAAAVANFAVSLGVPTFFLTVPDLLDWLRFAFDSDQDSFEERFEELRTVQLLVLDDFGTQNATPWAQEKLFQILNYRYVNQLATVVTTNLPMEQIEERIRSRLQDAELVRRVYIKAPDYRNPAGDMIHPELSSLGLHQQQTFSSFSLRTNENLPADDLRSLEKALKAARDFAERPKGWLVLQGSYGCGKTHLAAAIANYQTGEGTTTYFVVVPDLLDHLRATFSPSSNVSYDKRFEEVRTAPLLVLDDLGTQSATAWAREKLYQLFNYRYNAGLPTVITSALDLDEIDPRLRSRMLDTRLCKIYAITVPAYRGDIRKRRSKVER